MSDHANPESQAPTPSLALDRPVPLFEARSTHGPLSLEDYRGAWLILFSHPADFTPVCTSEFIAIQEASGEFERRSCNLIGLSVDSIYSHLAWVTNIREKFGVDITFPIVEDISMAISSAYGMLDSASQTTATVRAVFFIDPDLVLRAKILYPMQVGRSVDEILRTLSALQAAREHQMTTPEGWQVGDELVPMAPTTLAEAQQNLERPGATEWYYSNPKTIN